MRYTFALAALAATLAVGLRAQETEDAPAADGQSEQAQAPAAQPLDPKDYVRFEPLAQVITSQGACQVRLADGSFRAAELNRAYPFGTVFQTGPNGNLEVRLADRISFRLAPNSSATVAPAADLPRALRVRLIEGRVETSTPDDLKDLDALGVDCLELSARKMCGRAAFEIKSKGSVDAILLVHGITGRTSIQGPNYTVPLIRAQNQLQLHHALNHSYTRLTSLAGDYAIELQNGTPEPTIFTLTPKAQVKIWRKNAQPTGHIAVTTLAINPSGKTKNNFSFVAEGTSPETLTKGELDPNGNFVSSEGPENIRTGETVPAEEEQTENKDSKTAQ
ncbi:MAG: hypothetical protein ACI4X9_05970 [Kiritimatiellia bacterium]